MLSKIKTRIEEELRTEITSERQVVYLLVEIRKVLDLAQDKESFPTLRLYCDWVVHTKLDRRAARELLRKIDKSYFELLRGEVKQTQTHDLIRILSYNALKDDLRGFLQKHGISTAICERGRFLQFLEWLLVALKGCSLVCEAKDLNLEHLDKIVISEDTEGTIDAWGMPISMMICWKLFLKGESIVQISIDPHIGRFSVCVSDPDILKS